ncbi:MAG: hypothetical protein IJY42_01910, partial [Clostridia bacterium]|nr:hypothetical protein [Clostridia bacterium]
MKKFLALLLAGLLLTLCFVGCGEDEVGDDGEPDLTLSNDLVYDGFEYETNDEGNYSIVGYRIEQESVVTVPSEINGRP